MFGMLVVLVRTEAKEVLSDENAGEGGQRLGKGGRVWKGEFGKASLGKKDFGSEKASGNRGARCRDVRCVKELTKPIGLRNGNGGWGGL